jgi:hypothetical protein
MEDVEGGGIEKGDEDGLGLVDATRKSCFDGNDRIIITALNIYILN